MNPVLHDLLSLLQLKKIEESIFLGDSQDLGFHSVFGGQLMGQAVSAAQQSVTHDHRLHSFHCYFLRPGHVNKPIIYEVEHARDGSSFTSRVVVAIQTGKPIFHMVLSFQAEESGLSHQLPTIPEVMPPEQVIPEIDRIRKLAEMIPEKVRDKLTSQRPIDLRPIDTPDLLNPEPMEPVRHIWLRADGTLVDELSVHQRLLAYASDFSFIGTALNPHGVNFWNRKLKVASLSHGMWFHKPLRMDEWLLYHIDSPTAVGGRGFVRGQFFNQQGELVASTAQEELIRHQH